MTTGRKTDGAGFTLLELIAVLVLISTVLAIAAPSLRRFVHGRQAADTAAQVLALTHMARSQAAARACVYRLNVDSDGGAYWLTVQEAGAFVELEGEYGRRFQCPIGVEISLQRDTPVDDEELESFVQFHPDGRCDPVVIEVTGGDGEVLQVTCPSVSERFRIISTTREQQE